ncbi:prostamide/prostaglandin F synthase-like [Neodiprion pinetum]|uniref:Prostamide/prostaglandin F synthase n=1 Tax=Neodiprion lecontei TaxID=441921 RepID=A0A6J0C054_NEOLC|nr:prostamide/prostaglandin F synthase [Neodiprion lecontei]XP_046419742.1 prostamide/prostaglandin F synthase-like [Neodiprion fabricii]XP_046419743.1 prostamide/prostaglandin F synthase-like [Neodiprion fabricii]XP_046480708.1 prostamide/prostaglandin F synthase-like [Neodiprion pinetum]XP_046480709.1 prostamide/prostaglandin F synthase-like [Neodiprion pinetum]XP_046592405.1 prostamide/prostaglandin F synthase [Neodiprion lecontei]XP_046613877.1 prostamide/prostaglandin F synthase-like [Ne
MVDLTNISQNKIKNLTTGEVVPLESLWKDQTVVIVFFRRWGCMLCRVWAKEVSAIADLLKEHNVKLIGVGVEDFDSQEFVDGKFFKGELYVDIDKKTYAGLGFKRYNYFSVIASLFSGESRAAINKGRELKVSGNYKGDGLQNGGALVVKEGGKLLYSFKQDGPAQHVKNSKFLEVLGIPIPANIDEKTG